MRDDRERLLDIVEAATRVAAIVAMGRDRYENDSVVQDALIRRLEIIGEAATKVGEELKVRHPTLPWRRAAATRNRIVHGYFDVDLDLLWEIAVRDVPALADELRGIIDELS